MAADCSDCDHVKTVQGIPYCTFVEEFCYDVNKKSECPMYDSNPYDYDIREVVGYTDD